MPAQPPAQAEVSTTRKRPSPETLLVPLGILTPTLEEQQKQQQLFALAKELGFAIQDLRSLRRDFAQMLFSRMTNRLGKAVYQTVSFTMSFPRTAAQSLFPSHLLTNQCEKNLDWRASTLPEISELISDMLSELSPAASGLTRAVQPPSEKLARVFSVIMPSVEISHAVLPYGAERLYFNCQYAMFDNSATLHPPKDAERREILIADPTAAALRQQVLQDVLQLSLKNVRLSPFWWRQLGQEETALEVEAGRTSSQQRQRHAARLEAATARALAAPPPEPTYDVAEILEEVKTAGAARCWYLVRWEGYSPDWEAWRIHGDVGTPLETWEPLSVMKNTVALQTWKEAKRAAAQSSSQVLRLQQQ